MRLGKIKLILGIFIPFLSFFLMSQNTFAEWVQQSSTYVDSRSYTLDTVNGNLTTDQSFGTRSIPFNILSHIAGENRGLQEFVLFQSITDNSSDKFKSVIMDITVKQVRNNSEQQSINFMYPEDMGFTITTNKGNAYGSCVTNELGFDYAQYRCSGNAPEQATVTGVYMRIGDKSFWEKGQSDYFYIGTIDAGNYGSNYNTNNIQVTYVSVNLTTTADPLVNLTQTVIQQNQQIINGVNSINDKLDRAVGNIGGQNQNNISGATNQQTTNLIGILQSFFTEISSFSATSCELTLPFPNFLNGSQTVNICQGKDVLGNFITVISSLALIAFYIPLAIVLIKMIYNEIRSWTNG